MNRKTIPPTRHVADQRARMRRCLGRAAQEIRQTETELTISRRPFEICRGRFSGHRADRLLLGISGRELYKDLPGAFLETYTLDGKGRTPAKGDIFKNPALAKTLRLIGEKGRDAFYKGEIADKIDAFMQANGGFLRKADFEKHTITWVDPVSTNYRGYDVFELPPNGQGIATLQILNILEGFDLRAMGRNSPEALHAMIEAKKIAWADRAKFYADPAFAKIPLAGLLSKAYAAERRKLIDPNHAAKTVAPGNPALEPGRHDLHVHRG